MLFLVKSMVDERMEINWSSHNVIELYVYREHRLCVRYSLLLNRYNYSTGSIMNEKRPSLGMVDPGSADFPRDQLS